MFYLANVIAYAYRNRNFHKILETQLFENLCCKSTKKK